MNAVGVIVDVGSAIAVAVPNRPAATTSMTPAPSSTDPPHPGTLLLKHAGPTGILWPVPGLDQSRRHAVA